MGVKFNRGDEVTSSRGTVVKLVEKVSKSHWLVEIVATGDLRRVNQSYLNNGKFVTPVCRTVYGIGYLGNGKFVCRDSGVITNEYCAWANILKRCYTEYKGNITPDSYKDVEVCDEWHNYQNFAEWYTSNVKKFTEYNVVPKIDKDLKSNGVKLYSPSTCCFLPNIINSAIISNKPNAKLHNGVAMHEGKFHASIMHRYKRISCGSYNTLEEAVHAYKKKKVEAIRELANDYKHVLDEDVYKLLHEWYPS